MTDDTEFKDTIGKLFSTKIDHRLVLQSERIPLLRQSWDTLAELGLPWVGIAEEAGGSGGTIGDLVTLLEATGRHAVPLPLLENSLAAWLVTSSGGQAATEEVWTIAPGTPSDTFAMDRGRVSGTLRDVAWGQGADKIIVLIGGSEQTTVVIADTADASIEAGHDIAGQPWDTLTFAGARCETFDSAVSIGELAQRGAVLRAAQMTGAMWAVFELTKRYTAERQQFGRPIGTFQAVRPHLVYLAQAATMTGVSVGRSAAALESDSDAAFVAFATKLIANQNAGLSIKPSHQAHGAIGVTREYALQDYTRRLNAWRGDWGTELLLAERIGSAALQIPRFTSVATDQSAVAL